jgi:ElaB/YqjD/DUF883 family membrane-anchored ribosome-binding protein
MAAGTDVATLDRKQQRNLTRLQAHDNARAARDELAATLSALEDRLNLPKRVARASARAKRRFQRFAEEQPGTAAAIAVGAAVAVGVTVWLGVRAKLGR